MCREGPEAADTLLIRSFLAGERVAFDRLVLRYKDRVFNLCFRLLGDYHDASDCAQETFIKVHRALPRFRFESAFSTWLYRIAVNTCKSSRSSLAFRMKKSTVSLDGMDAGAHQGLEASAGNPHPTPDQVLERRERERHLQEAIGALPHAQRAVVVLRDVEGLSYEEIARIAGLKPGTVKSKLSRARNRLREKLEGLL